MPVTNKDAVDGNTAIDAVNGNAAANGTRASILLVDDEQIVVTSITAFLELDGQFDVFGFTDPAEALRFAQAHSVDVVICDYRMPVLNGLQLLRQIKEAQPEASRILLTSHADARSAIEAINKVGLFQYLEKPWDNEQLLLVIQSGVERSRLLLQLRERVGELDSAHSVIQSAPSRLIRAFL
jgi:DNA-binding NtrC family response regulator